MHPARLIVRLLSVTSTAKVECLAFSPDGARVAAACYKANVRVWESGSGKPAFNLKGTKDFKFVGFAADPDELVTSSWSTPVNVWDLRTMALRAIGPVPKFCWDTALSRDGTRIARSEGTIGCRDTASGRTLWEVEFERSGIRPLVCFDAAGARLFVVSKRVAVLDALTGAELSGFDLTFRKYPTLDAADVSSDGRWLALRGADGMQVRDTADGRQVFEEPSINYGRALAFTPDGSQLAAGPYGGDRGFVHFWDVGTWRRGPSLDLGIGSITALAFSADGLLGAAGGFHGQLALWDRE
jgi:WD40 repeat protein